MSERGGRRGREGREGAYDRSCRRRYRWSGRRRWCWRTGPWRSSLRARRRRGRGSRSSGPAKFDPKRRGSAFIRVPSITIFERIRYRIQNNYIRCCVSAGRTGHRTSTPTTCSTPSRPQSSRTCPSGTRGTAGPCPWWAHSVPSGTAAASSVPARCSTSPRGRPCTSQHPQC